MGTLITLSLCISCIAYNKERLCPEDCHEETKPCRFYIHRNKYGTTSSGKYMIIAEFLHPLVDHISHK
jgi:hypothetical protein